MYYEIIVVKDGAREHLRLDTLLQVRHFIDEHLRSEIFTTLDINVGKVIGKATT